MKSNLAMKKLLKSPQTVASLTDSLLEIAERSFEIKGNCYVLKALVPPATNATHASFQDCTGYECFFNSVHVEDYDAEAPLDQAILFVNRVFQVWRDWEKQLILIAIISADEFSVVVKFHVIRPSERWVSENLESYVDPILSVESSEDVFAALTSLRLSFASK